ncbi:hypothetical protein PSYMP_03490 [Pseudomonas amygdali pv. morsprunorum str. M302280]|nr:hypothetical protein PSYMP_03490 [Pseudomonas amygdali pv. morsprunorum str. M302280]
MTTTEPDQLDSVSVADNRRGPVADGTSKTL